MSNRQEFPQVVTWGDEVDVPKQAIAIRVDDVERLILGKLIKTDIRTRIINGLSKVLQTLRTSHHHVADFSRQLATLGA